MPLDLDFGERPAGTGAEEGSGRFGIRGAASSGNDFRLRPAKMFSTGFAAVRVNMGALTGAVEVKSKLLTFLLEAEKNCMGSTFSVSTSSNSVGALRFTAPDGVAVIAALKCQSLVMECRQ